MATKELSSTIVIPNASYTKEADLVAGWTKKAGTMLEKTPVEVGTMFDAGWSVLIYSDGLAVAHAGITFDWEGKWMELGAVVTEEQHRGMGLGTIAVNALLTLTREKFPGRSFFALCNDQSLNIFKKFGGVEMDPRLLPESVWGACAQCPKFLEARTAGKVCCDTPINMTEVGK